MTLRIAPYAPAHRAAVLELSLRAWAPVFDMLEPAVPGYVYEAFYPAGWRARQTADIERLLDTEGERIWLAIESGEVAGFIGLREHPEDKMGEIYILAVDPEHQRRGVGKALMAFAFARLRDAGFAMVMVETGDDPGHGPSRAAYEKAGFERWPVARYFKKL